VRWRSSSWRCWMRSGSRRFRTAVAAPLPHRCATIPAHFTAVQSFILPASWGAPDGVSQAAVDAMNDANPSQPPLEQPCLL
jgi:hypothetical protein